MLTTTVSGRTWNFSHAIGRNAAAGNGFTQPTDVAVAPGGVIYVLSRGQEGAGGVQAPNKRIGKVTITEEFIGDFAREELVWPMGIAVDSNGNIYCTDEFDKRIKIYDVDGQRVGEWDGGENLASPSGIACDADDNLFITDADSNEIHKFTSEGKHLASFGGAGSGPGQLNRPWGIVIGSDGCVYVADWGNNRAQKFSADGEHLATYGEETSGLAGALNHPSDIAVDSEGDVYVSDWGNKLVKIYENHGPVLTQLEGDAVEFSKWAKEVVESNPDVVKAYRRVKDTRPLGLFERPCGLAVDDEDRIIITDSTRGRLQIYAKEKDYMDPQFNL